MTRWDRRVPFVVFPPFVEGAIGSDVETLFRGRSFCKSVAYVGSEDE
jgi:hypothetical protein